jgi:hypothetical protein
VSGIQTSLASVIVRYLIFSAEEKDRKKRDYFLQERDIFFIFPAELSFLGEADSGRGERTDPS